MLSRQTGMLITIPRVTPCKIMSSVIESIYTRAKKGRITSLKFFNHKKEPVLLAPIDLNIGVGVRIKMMMIPKIQIKYLPWKVIQMMKITGRH